MYFPVYFRTTCPSTATRDAVGSGFGSRRCGLCDQSACLNEGALSCIFAVQGVEGPLKPLRVASVWARLCVRCEVIALQMSSDSSQAHSLASSPRSSGSHNETIVRPSRSSTTTTISFPFSSIAHRWAEFRSTLATFSGVGNIDGRGGTNSARFTLRVEVEPDGGGSQHEESIRRRGDLASGRTDSRPLTPLRQSSGEAEPALAGPLDREEETTAAAAERYRLTSGTPGIDLQVRWVRDSQYYGCVFVSWA